MGNKTARYLDMLIGCFGAANTLIRGTGAIAGLGVRISGCGFIALHPGSRIDRIIKIYAEIIPIP